jgi:hypothetical protein
VILARREIYKLPSVGHVTWQIANGNPFLDQHAEKPLVEPTGEV